MNNRKILFLPIETISRELDSKLALISELMGPDLICFLGQHDAIDRISQFYNNGVYVGKNVFKTFFPTNMKLYEAYKSNSHSILWLHEEGGIYAGIEKDWRKTLDQLLDPSILSKDDQILTWGNFQKKHYQKKGPAEVTTVGSPRFNLSKDSLLRRLVQKFNRVKLDNFILINTNFSIANYSSHLDSVLDEQYRGHDDQESQHKVIQGYAEEKRTLAHFIEVVSELALRYPKEKFVLRPHPTESSDIYKSIFSIYKNIIISKDYSAIEWIDKCKVLIQNGCTTSIEGHLMGKKVLNFYPFSPTNMVLVTQDIGINCKNIDELAHNLFGTNIDLKLAAEKRLSLNRLLDNTNSTFDASHLADVIKSTVDRKDFCQTNLSLAFIRTYLFIFKAFVINACKRIPRLLFFPKRQKDYQMFCDAFPGMNREEISQKIKFLSKDQKKDIDCLFLSKDLIMLRSGKV